MPLPNDLNQIFSKNATDLNRPRSRFPRPHKRYTTMEVGKLYVVDWQEVLAGDTVSRSTKTLLRSLTPKFPTMDHAFCDIYNFFIPYRILQTNFKRIFGEAETPWVSNQEYYCPVIKFDYDAAPILHSVGDSFGLPVSDQIEAITRGTRPDTFKYEVLAYPGRAYAMTWNEYFRDVNLQPAAYVPLDDSDRNFADIEDLDDPYQSAYAYGALLPVSRVHDYFSSALPSPQRGSDVSVSLATRAPVITGANHPFEWTGQGIRWYTSTGTTPQNSLAFPVDQAGNVLLGQGFFDGAYSGRAYDNEVPLIGDSQNLKAYFPANLYADLSQAAATTINELRLAVATQQYLEMLARGGNRYRSFLYTFFGVTSPDASQQIPQYLSGRRIPLHVSQVLQQSSDDGSQLLGSTGAYSLTFDSDKDFTASFSEYGMLLTVACVRTTHTYTQGLEKKWTRRSALDFYTPVFANIGEMPINRGEIAFTGNPNVDESAFGYQEAFAEYRYAPNTGTGLFRAQVPDNLLPWTYIDDYSSVPFLNQDWISEPKENFARSLAVQADGTQIFGEIAFDDVWTRVMPVHSIPGLYRL